MARVINFAPGPATLPVPVLERAREDMLELGSTGVSIVEHSHRGKDYAVIHEEAKSLVREVLGLPNSHRILFMQGGARGQFAIVPMNLLEAGRSADYVNTGVWSTKALAEAKLLGTAREAFSAKESDGSFRRVPEPDELPLDPNASYVHITTNNTIYGTQFFRYPKTEAPLVADMSSDIAWAPIDYGQFGLFYAGAQKNLGVPGVTLVVIDEALLERARTDIPDIFRYRTVADSDSLMNTAPTFAIYMLRNVLDWIRDQGGLPRMEARNREKAELLYGALEATGGFYRCPVEKASRSVMNVVFRLPSEELEATLVAEAKSHGMVGIKGHRSAGGIRVSLYNAIEPAQVRTLVSFLEDFADRHG